jgi:hypothetical protein
MPEPTPPIDEPANHDPDLEYRSYRGGQEPGCEVFHGWTWHPGFIRGWHRRERGWYATVEFSVTEDAGPANYLRTVHSDFVRKAEAPAC